MASTPFVLSTHGRWEIPHPAERAVVHVTISSEGLNKASVSDEIVTTAHHIERLLSELSPDTDTPEAKEAAALAHWSKTSLSATSYLPFSTGKHTKPRQYRASIIFDIRFRHFKELGAFSTKLSALSHTEISHIDWILTAATYKAHQSKLRKLAANNALEKAQDYCEVLGCVNVRPTELQEGNVTMPTGNAYGNTGGSLFGSGGGGLFGHQQQQRAQKVAQQESDTRDESPLEFTPNEVRMSMDVTVRFQAM